jgi:AAA domain, putative AbiEii toxin, Type IV TA system
VEDDADLAATPLNALRNEANRLQLLIGLDQRKTIQLRALDDKIAKAEIALSKVAERITDTEGARARIKALNERRKAEYAAMFDAFREEQEQLALLYEPLAASFHEAGGVLGKLVFTVRRDVDVERWAKTGEDLLDLRTGPFKGVGSLLRAAHEKLANAWRHGSGTDAADAMATFREECDDTILEHAPAHARESQEAFWAWGADVASWLDNTDHIELRYGVQYDGVQIEQLSPGTRGIVLLLPYLSIDRNDDRPLIIDQPEENLDPKSVFEELVGEFSTTRQRRQVIIVTHDANLIVNTDADQVIVASSGPHRPNDLPEISYLSGGLENPEIRRKVCEILEGGEEAFKERARRLRIRIRNGQ